MPKCIHCGINRRPYKMAPFGFSECLECRRKLNRNIEKQRMKFSARYRKYKRLLSEQP
jgi:hypothetical protein